MGGVFRAFALRVAARSVRQVAVNAHRRVARRLRDEGERAERRGIGRDDAPLVVGISVELDFTDVAVLVGAGHLELVESVGSLVLYEPATPFSGSPGRLPRTRKELHEVARIRRASPEDLDCRRVLVGVGITGPFDAKRLDYDWRLELVEELDGLFVSAEL